MIRIEIEIREKTPGKVMLDCSVVQGCWCKPTAGEDRVADALYDMIRRESPDVGKRLGGCEEIKGEDPERRERG